MQKFQMASRTASTGPVDHPLRRIRARLSAGGPRRAPAPAGSQRRGPVARAAVLDTPSNPGSGPRSSGARGPDFCTDEDDYFVMDDLIDLALSDLDDSDEDDFNPREADAEADRLAAQLEGLRERIAAQGPVDSEVTVPDLLVARAAREAREGEREGGAAEGAGGGSSEPQKPESWIRKFLVESEPRPGPKGYDPPATDPSQEQPGSDGLLPLPLTASNLPWGPAATKGVQVAREKAEEAASETSRRAREAATWLERRRRELNESAGEKAMELMGRFLGERDEGWRDEWRGLDSGFWPRMQWLWERPNVQRMRISFTLANLTIRFPAMLAILFTQMSLIATQVSLPMLAPVLLGTGIAVKSIMSNAQVIFPRIGLTLVFLWCLWFLNTALTSTIALLQRQGTLDARMAGAFTTFTEVTTLTAALVVMLSMLGVNVSGLLLPTAILGAFACKDLSLNLMAGFFLFLVAPFKHGDTVSVPTSAAGAGAPSGQSAPPGGVGVLWPVAPSPPPSWFSGVCESVDLRYTVLRSGSRRLFMPNATFVQREFIVEDGPAPPDGGEGIMGRAAGSLGFGSNNGRGSPSSSGNGSGNNGSGNGSRPSSPGSAGARKSPDSGSRQGGGSPGLSNPSNSSSGPTAASSQPMPQPSDPWPAPRAGSPGSKSGPSPPPMPAVVVAYDPETVRRVWTSLGFSSPGAGPGMQHGGSDPQASAYMAQGFPFHPHHSHLYGVVAMGDGQEAALLQGVAPYSPEGPAAAQAQGQGQAQQAPGQGQPPPHPSSEGNGPPPRRRRNGPQP